MRKDWFQFLCRNNMKNSLIEAIIRRFGVGLTLQMLVEYLSAQIIKDFIIDVISENYNSLDDFLNDQSKYQKI